MTIRALTLCVMPRLRKLITNPSRVMSSPRKTIVRSPLLLVVFPGFALQEKHHRRAESDDANDERDIAHISGQAGGDQSEGDEKETQCLRLSGIGSHVYPPDLSS